MQKLVKETAIAAVVFALLSLLFGLGGNDAKEVGPAIVSGLTFAVFYFVIGAIMRWFKGRNS